MPNKGLLASFPDPLLSEKFLDFANYPSTDIQLATDIDEAIIQDLYHQDKNPVYYQGKLEGDGAVQDLEQFITSESFQTFKSELDRCFSVLTAWTEQQNIEISSYENEIHAAEFLLNNFLARLKGDFFSNQRTKLYSGGKRNIEMITIFLQNEAIPLEFRKTQIISLLEDDGLAVCAEGCYSRLNTISDILSNYLDINTVGLIKKFIITITETALTLPMRVQLCNAVGISPENHDIHAVNYFLKRLKTELNIGFLNVSDDSFTRLFTPIRSRFINVQIDSFYNHYKVEFKKALTASSLVQFMAFKLGNPPIALLNNLLNLLDKKGQAAAYAISDEMLEEGQGTVENSNLLTITLTDYLFDEKWLDLNLKPDSRLYATKNYFFKRNPSWHNAWQEGFAFEPLADNYHIYYANLALSWIVSAGKKKRIVNLLSEERGLTQLKLYFADTSAESINSLLQTPHDLNLFFESLPPSQYRAGLAWLQPHLKLGLVNRGAEPKSLLTVYELSNDIKRFKPLLKFLSARQQRLLTTVLIEIDKSAIKEKLQNRINHFLGLSLTPENAVQTIRLILQPTLQHLISQGMKDFSGLTFTGLQTENPDEILPSYLEKIDFSHCNLEDVNFAIAVYECDFTDCDLSHTTINDKEFLHSDNIFTRCKFSTSVLATILPEADQRIYLPEADLSDVDFQDVRIKEKINALAYIDLTGVDLSAKNLQGCFSRGNPVFLENANLINTNLDDNDLSNTDLSEAKLAGASIQNTQLDCNQLFEFYEQGHRDFRSVSLIGKFPAKKTLAGAHLSMQAFAQLAKNNFVNFSEVNLQSIPKDMLAIYIKEFKLVLTDAQLPDDFNPAVDEASTTVDVIGCLVRRQKRNANHCLISWQDVDEFNTEKQESRNTEKIKIASDHFNHYLAETANVYKQTQLLKLAGLYPLQGSEVSRTKLQQNILRQSIRESFAKLGNLSHLMYGLISKDLLVAIGHGEYKAIAFNGGFLATTMATGAIADGLTATSRKLFLANSELILANTLQSTAPFIRRVTSVFFIYQICLQIQALQSGNKAALANMISNSVMIGGDVTELIIEWLEITEIISDLSPITAPVISTLGVVALLASQITNAVNQVEKIAEFMPLSGWDKLTYGWELFLGIRLNRELEEFISLASTYQKIIQNSLEFLNANPAITRYVIPSIQATYTPGTFSCIPTPTINNLFFIKIYCQNNTKIELKTLQDSHIILSAPYGMEEIFNASAQPLLNHVDKDEKLYHFLDKSRQEKKLFCFSHDLQNQSQTAHENYYCANSLGIMDEGPQKTGNTTLFDLGGGNDTVVGFANSANIFKFDARGYKEMTGGKQNDLFIATFFKEDNQYVESLAYLSGGQGIDTVLIGVDIAIGSRDFSVQDGVPHYTLDSQSHQNSTLTFGNATLYLSDMNHIQFNSYRNEVLFLPSGLPKQSKEKANKKLTIKGAGKLTIDPQGGRISHNSLFYLDPDIIDIANTNTSALADISLKLAHPSKLNNAALSGNFSYIFSDHPYLLSMTENTQTVLLRNNSDAMHQFFFNYTLLDIHAIHLTTTASLEAAEFSFLPSPGNELLESIQQIIFNPVVKGQASDLGEIVFFLKNPQSKEIIALTVPQDNVKTHLYRDLHSAYYEVLREARLRRGDNSDSEYTQAEFLNDLPSKVRYGYELLSSSRQQNIILEEKIDILHGLALLKAIWHFSFINDSTILDYLQNFRLDGVHLNPARHFSLIRKDLWSIAVLATNSLDIHVNSLPKKANFFFRDNASLIVDKKQGVFMTQITTLAGVHSIEKMLPVSYQLKIPLFIHSNTYNETVNIIGKEHHALLYNNPLLKRSYFVDKGGEHVYNISPQPGGFFTEQIVLYQPLDKKTKTLNLRALVNALHATRSDLERDDVIVYSLIPTATGDLYLLLYPNSRFLEAQFPPPQKPLMNLLLKNGQYWYRQIHIVFNSWPYRIRCKNAVQWQLNPLDLIFSEKNHFNLIQESSIEKNQTLIIHTYSTATLEFFVDKNNLLLSNCLVRYPAQPEAECFALLFENFYLSKKMPSLNLSVLNLASHANVEYSIQQLSQKAQGLNTSTSSLKTRLAQFKQEMLADLSHSPASQPAHVLAVESPTAHQQVRPLASSAGDGGSVVTRVISAAGIALLIGGAAYFFIHTLRRITNPFMGGVDANMAVAATLPLLEKIPVSQTNTFVEEERVMKEKASLLSILKNSATNFDSSLQLLTLIACQFSGQTLARFKPEQTLTDSEAMAYAAAIVEEIEAAEDEKPPIWQTLNTVKTALLRGSKLTCNASFYPAAANNESAAIEIRQKNYRHG